MKLSAELVPQTVWYKSLAKLLPRSVWNNIRQEVIDQNGLRCQICGETEGVFNLHEIWRYDDVNHVQSLDGFILLCTMCHHVKHIGLAGILADEGKLDYDKLIEHFCKVNGCSREDFETHVEDAFRIWKKRSLYPWNQDFGKYRLYFKEKTLPLK